MKRYLHYKIIRYFLRGLSQLEYGGLMLVTPRGVARYYGDMNSPLQARMELKSWSVIVNAARRGDIGLGEDYIDHLWDSPDIGTLIELFSRNVACFEQFIYGNILHRTAFRVINFMRNNRKTQSRRNIKAHYDVGNEFYALWLDKSMTYSSALYASDDAVLEDAQRAKYERILSCLPAPNNDQTILEIGCGWGGFAEHAATNDKDVTALTISEAQYRFTKERLSKQGLINRVKLKLQDYRDSSGTFDAIVSIEMFEAVGEQYWSQYFNTVRQRLKKGGKAIIQVITIDDALFDDYRTSSDFIRRYTFPGGMLPSVKRFSQEAGDAGLACQNIHRFGRDYARTLQDWLSRFDAQTDTIRAMGYNDDFIRSWRYYLGACIGAFRANRIDVIQVELTHA